MSSYANQILTSLSQYNQMNKEASDSGETIQEAPEGHEAQEGLSHLEKYAMTKQALLPALGAAMPWLMGALGLGSAGYMGHKMLTSKDKYNDYIPFNEPSPGEPGFDPLKAWAGNNVYRQHHVQGMQGNPYSGWNPYQGGPGGRYGRNGYPVGPYGGFGPYGGRGGRRARRDFRARQNPSNYGPGGRFIANKDKRKAWRAYQKEERGNARDFLKNYGKDPAPAAPVAPAPAPATPPPASAGVA